VKEWNDFLQSLDRELGKKAVDEWLRPLKVVRFDAGNLYLDPPSPLHVSWFDEYAKAKASLHLKSAGYRPIKIHWIKESKPSQPQLVAASPFQNDLLDPTATLDQFIQSDKNKIAYCLFESWLKTGKILYNPLFLFGPANSGKTHLLMAVANHFSKTKKVIFIRANTFTEHLVAGIRSAKMDQFRAHYRDADLLIVDQIDQIGGRTSTQEEFFHTFNSLHTQGKQILLASRLPPSKLADVEPRLISRFEWGLPLEMGLTHAKILIQKKSFSWNLQLDLPLIDFLAERFPHDPVIPLQALSLRSTKNIPITKEIGIKLLQDLLAAKEKNAPNFENILEEVATHFSISASDITGKSQRREHAFPRQIAMYLCREKLKMPYLAIGKLFGRDHSTVMSSVKQIEEKIQHKDPSLSNLIITP
jgi:chromosomal replication initiator protein